MRERDRIWPSRTLLLRSERSATGDRELTLGGKANVCGVSFRGDQAMRHRHAVAHGSMRFISQRKRGR